MSANSMTSNAGYDQDASTLAAQYEAISFQGLHGDVAHLFPNAPSRVLDIGAGSGRDAAALADIGHTVVAVEPTAALRHEGMRLHEGQRIEWIDDQLPDLRVTCARQERFDLIMLIAVWMHLDERERQTAMQALPNLVATGGRVVMSLRHGPVPAGRRMFAVSARETIDLARSAGFRCIHEGRREDAQGRPEVNWSVIVLEKT